MKTATLSAILFGSTASASVTCEFTADNNINAVYVDGKDLTDKVQGDRYSWPAKKTLTFPSSASTLAIAAEDNEEGCKNGGVAIKCSDSDPTSVWNVNSNDRESFHMASSREDDDVPDADWYAKDYKATSSRWDKPRYGYTTYADSIIGVHDLCAGENQPDTNNKMFLRLQPQGKVLCEFTADNFIKKVYVDGKDLTDKVQGDKDDWTKKKFVTFPASSSTLAILASDAEYGCKNGGLAIKCIASGENAAIWTVSSNDRDKFLMASSENINDVPDADWFAYDYKATSSRWDKPRYGYTTYADSVIGVHDICAGENQPDTNNKMFARLQVKDPPAMTWTVSEQDDKKAYCADTHSTTKWDCGQASTNDVDVDKQACLDWCQGAAFCSFDAHASGTFATRCCSRSDRCSITHTPADGRSYRILEWAPVPLGKKKKKKAPKPEFCLDSEVIRDQASTSEGGMGGWGCFSRNNGNHHGNCHTHGNYQGHSSTFHIHGNCPHTQGGIQQAFPTVENDVYTLQMECYAGNWDQWGDVDDLHISTDGGSSWKKYNCDPHAWQTIEHRFTAQKGNTNIIVWSDKGECIDVDNIKLNRCARPKFGEKCHPDNCNKWECRGEASWCKCWEEGVEYPKCPSDEEDDTCLCSQSGDTSVVALEKIVRFPNQHLDLTGGHAQAHHTQQKFCEGMGGRLPTFKEVCPDGEGGQPALSCTSAQDHSWVPYSKDENSYAYISCDGHGGIICKDHVTHHENPNWGYSGDVYGSNVECMLPEDAPYFLGNGEAQGYVMIKVSTVCDSDPTQCSDGYNVWSEVDFLKTSSEGSTEVKVSEEDVGTTSNTRGWAVKGQWSHYAPVDDLTHTCYWPYGSYGHGHDQPGRRGSWHIFKIVENFDKIRVNLRDTCGYTHNIAHVAAYHCSGDEVGTCSLQPFMQTSGDKTTLLGSNLFYLFE